LKENEFRTGLGFELKRHSQKSKQKLWKTASSKLLASRKNRPEVNVGQISRHSKEGSQVLVPGKVLGVGNIDHKVTVAAYSFSRDAAKKIQASGGTCLDISEFMKSQTSVKDVLLLG
jgi:large subunit ribosomal protein L18e